MKVTFALKNKHPLIKRAKEKKKERKKNLGKPSISLTSAGRPCSTIRFSICSGGRN